MSLIIEKSRIMSDVWTSVAWWNTLKNQAHNGQLLEIVRGRSAEWPCSLGGSTHYHEWLGRCWCFVFETSHRPTGEFFGESFTFMTCYLSISIVGCLVLTCNRSFGFDCGDRWLPLPRTAANASTRNKDEGYPSPLLGMGYIPVDLRASFGGQAKLQWTWFQKLFSESSSCVTIGWFGYRFPLIMTLHFLPYFSKLWT